MPDKQPGKSEPSAEDEALKDQVDAMMGAKGPDSTPAVSMDQDQAARPKQSKTAPELSKVHKPEVPAEPPLVIKLADEKTPTADTEDPVVPAADPKPGTNIEDSATEEAVDDIAADESDRLLAVDDARVAHKERLTAGSSWKDKLKGLAKDKRAWGVIAALLVIVLALPATRYPLLGLVIKKPVTITVVDSKTATPVSSAQVQLAGDSVKTDANGHVHLRVALGHRTLKITKQYYQSLSTAYFVGFKAAPAASIQLSATGRLVPITVTNKITGKPLSGAEVKLKGTTAKTNAKGEATVALPTTANSYNAKLSLAGYNDADITVTVTDQVVKANNFELTPAGHVYFLSNLSGSLDVVKANLDGTGRKTVLAGTGKEDPNTTSLLASRDWHFLVLKARRDSNQPALYLIDTNSDKVTQFDNGDADFSLVGWYGHNFIYSLTRNTLSNWQAGRIALKSYDADNLQLNQLDQNQAEGTAPSYAYQHFYNFYILNGLVVYNTQWNTFSSTGTAYDTTGKTATIRAVQPNDQNKKDYQTFPAGTTGYIQAALYQPQAIYFAVYDNSNGKTTYYDYENQVVKTASIDNNTFTLTYPTFLVSPNGNQTFWTELRDGKNSLFIGDTSASSKKQIASLSDYSPYGWYGDNYVLVSKNSSQLFIMPASGLANGQQPVKLTDYYKPAQTYNGYGYGYGGL